MQLIRLAIIIALSSLLLTSCTNAIRNPVLKTDPTNETWMPRVVTAPQPFWTKGADRWFFVGGPTNIERANRHAAYDAAISTMTVRVPNFTKIRVQGDFHVEIFGTPFPNSVYVYGPNLGLRQIIVEMRGDVLCLRQVPNASRAVQQMVVRVGVQQLTELTQAGCGLIEGSRIHSNCLSIVTTPASVGNVYLAGNMNLKSIDKMGRASITVLGANSPNMRIRTDGSGMVNIAGNIGVSSIEHHGNVGMNLVGVNSNSLRIEADGGGKISLSGPANIKRICAKGSVCVYAYPVTSQCLNVSVFDNASVGLMGTAHQLTVDTYGNGVFLGKKLCTKTAEAKARNNSHINMTASQRAFASASQQATIYFYGPADLVSSFVEDSAVVIPIGQLNMCAIKSFSRPVIGSPRKAGEG